MIYRVEIAFLFILLERLKLEREQVFLDMEQLTSDLSFPLEKLFLKQVERAFRVERWSC